ncbi:coil containing protein [Vibrio phage 1.139.A._10N.261.48.C6]|nr:coil containing protein [Vibrio phage 1.034.O._10N.261.46.B7]AUR83453.1 coil containing protein [Vibrio phage 1.034.X._10N.261.46.B7]AUR90191.1 coil containing protein [Vibrio phage 1.139.A._10N.261.48.C6]AUR90258.1 coil containing protein [Vibrio phage 1.139.B._10N.261.48.C6]AUR95580.1 coil containing protein [Vibrio phage 1.209.O._10N.222.52.B2]
MATVAAIAGVIGAVTGVVGAVQQRKAAKKATAEQKRQNALNNRVQEVNQRRDIRRSIAASRAQQAQLEQGGIDFGVQGSSIVAGAQGAAQTDLATSIGSGFANQGASAGFAASRNRQADAMLDVQNNIYTDVSNFAGNFTHAGVNEVYKSELTGLFS